MKRTTVNVVLDEETIARAEAKAAAEHRSLSKYVEHLVLCDLAGPGVPVATILVPQIAEDLTQLPIKGEDPRRARRRSDVANDLFRPRED